MLGYSRLVKQCGGDMTNEGKATTLMLARLAGPFILASFLGLAIWILVDPFLGGFWTLGTVVVLLAKLTDNIRVTNRRSR